MYKIITTTTGPFQILESPANTIKMVEDGIHNTVYIYHITMENIRTKCGIQAIQTPDTNLTWKKIKRGGKVVRKVEDRS